MSTGSDFLPTRATAEAAIEVALGDHAPDFDIPGFAEHIHDRHGTWDVEALSHALFWKLATRFDTRDTDPAPSGLPDLDATLRGEKIDALLARADTLPEGIMELQDLAHDLADALRRVRTLSVSLAGSGEVTGRFFASDIIAAMEGTR